jgi:hypothetical protein
MKPPVFKTMSQSRVLAAMTLAPMLCFAGCAVAYKSSPSILTTPMGNAVIATLPAGSEIRVKENAAALCQAFANEIAPATERDNGWQVLRTTAPLKIATESYITERDQREIFYATEILKLRSLLKERNNPSTERDDNGK